MPAAVLVEGVLETVVVAFAEEGEDVATCFVPDRNIIHRYLAHTGFLGVVYVVIVIQVCGFYQRLLDEETIVSNRGYLGFHCSAKVRNSVILSHVVT